MTTAYENPISIIDHDGMPQSLPVITTVTINEGDLVCWDETNFTLRALTAATDVEPGKSTGHATWTSAGLVGVAVGSSKPEVYGGAAEVAVTCIPVICKAVVFLKATASEKYPPFKVVKMGADAQTVTSAGNPAIAAGVGYVIVDPPAVARPEQATPVPEEAEGGRVRVLLVPKFAPAAVI